MFALEQALERYDLLNRQIKRSETRIDALVEALADTAHESAVEQLAQPARTPRERRRQLALQAMLGVDLTAIPTIGIETAPATAHGCGGSTPGAPIRRPPTRLVYAMLMRGEEYVAWEVADFEAERAATRAAPTELSVRASAPRAGRKRPGQVEAALPILVGLLPGLGRDHFAQGVEIRIADEVQIFPGLVRHQR